MSFMIQIPRNLKIVRKESLLYMFSVNVTIMHLAHALRVTAANPKFKGHSPIQYCTVWRPSQANSIDYGIDGSYQGFQLLDQDHLVMDFICEGIKLFFSERYW